MLKKSISLQQSLTPTNTLLKGSLKPYHKQPLANKVVTPSPNNHSLPQQSETTPLDRLESNYIDAVYISHKYNKKYIDNNLDKLLSNPISNKSKKSNQKPLEIENFETIRQAPSITQTQTVGILAGLGSPSQNEGVWTNEGRYRQENHKLSEAYIRERGLRKKFQHDLNTLRFAFKQLEVVNDTLEKESVKQKEELASMNNLIFNNKIHKITCSGSQYALCFDSKETQTQIDDFIEACSEQGSEYEDAVSSEVKLLEGGGATKPGTQQRLSRASRQSFIVEKQLLHLKEKIAEQEIQTKKRSVMYESAIQKLQDEKNNLRSELETISSYVEHLKLSEKESVERLKEFSRQLKLDDQKIRQFLQSEHVTKVYTLGEDTMESVSQLFREQIQYLVYLCEKKHQSYDSILKEAEYQLKVSTHIRAAYEKKLEELKNPKQILKGLVVKWTKFEEQTKQGYHELHRAVTAADQVFSRLDKL